MTYSVCLIVQVEEYEYDEAMEPSYRASQFKLFNKTLEDGFFPMIVVDAINHKVGWSGQCFLYWVQFGLFLGVVNTA